MEVASFSPSGGRVDTAAKALAGGAMALLVDRAEEVEAGHLIAAAETVTDTAIATMLREAVGMPWIALPAERCEALGLRRMGDGPNASGREMLVTFEAREGVTTGISAADRALSMRVAAAAGSTGAEIVTPGHVLPVRVPAEGPLRGWTAAEAAVELAALAGRPGGAALCQVMDESGRPALEPALGALAERLGIPLVESPDLLDRRLGRTALVERAADERSVDSPVGDLRCVSYRDRERGSLHFALLLGDTAGPRPTRVEALAQDVPADVFGRAGSGSRERLEAALSSLDGRGVLLYLAPAPLAAPGDDFLAASRRAHLVTQILRDLGIAAVQTAG